ncbi:LutC/YkgG family protein [Paenibacillus sacheonensis]|uniref:Lactate utilization protein C n=1 Tax=Paenibacillus sacheonensis TaxID=742054 RepID=A0A7X4YJK1_9BACL|nr:lactate utilization protein [Paenibacillus sacheonensis]MBM7564161.1 L-lactate dehydrogenase complex protein LldG [Paenibacillus sacheonensis]NBC67510.1 lactate utilization protein C [Paenibacillus sacheonensis]
MAKTDEHQAWLAELEAKSRAKQVGFINGISGKLRRPRSAEPPAHPFRGAPEFWNEFEWPIDERVEKFRANFKAAGGHSERLATMEDARAFIASKAEEMSAKYVIRQNQPELNALGLEEAIPDASFSVWNSDAEEHWKARAAEADFGIVVADYAAAYTGSVTVLSSKDKGRSVSLLPTVLMVIIPIERLHTRLGQILVNFDQAGRENLPAGIHFISGPSRSADIENDLTIGVHGPGVVYTLIVG